MTCWGDAVGVQPSGESEGVVGKPDGDAGCKRLPNGRGGAKPVGSGSGSSPAFIDTAGFPRSSIAGANAGSNTGVSACAGDSVYGS